MPSIGYLHFTDLHLGMGPQKWLWPTFRDLLHDDLRRTFQRSGQWDVVLFSGDLVQSGQRAEFEKLNIELEALWKLFSELGCQPVLTCVPGNHDLLRPTPTLPVIKVMRNWFDDAEVRQRFWDEPSSEYRHVVIEAFANYQNWFNTSPVPTLRPQHQGLLPGDGAAMIEGRGIKLGIVGLNSSFLQLTGDDYEGRLDLDVRQFNSATGGDPGAWCREADICLLMTHHNVAWLNRHAQESFRSEIYPSGRFFAQYCGHLHNPTARDVREAGAEVRRLRLGTSLFGLEKWGTNQESRVHGYAAGRIELSDGEGTEYFWPRIAGRNYAGDWRINPDIGYDLDDDNAMVTHFDSKYRASISLRESCSVTIACNEEANEATTPISIQAEPVAEDHAPDWSLVAVSLDDASAKAKLGQVPRVRLRGEPHHEAVRKEEQSRLELALRQRRAGWVIADWGLGKDGFIGCILARLGLDGRHADVFRLRCEDAETIDAMFALFDEQFGLPFSEFFGSVSALDKCCLIFDGVSNRLLLTTFGDDQSTRFHEIIATILDYAPKLNIVLTARRSPQSSPYESIQLQALELLEVRDYLEHHPQSSAEALALETQELLYERSGGLPVHLDRLLSTLAITSLGEVLQDELESDFTELNSAERIPKALKQAVGSLSEATDRYSRRSFKLLKVLTILSSGETLESIKRFYPTEPFHHQNITQLLNLSLLEVLPVHLPLAEIPHSSNALTVPVAAPKILKVPRQVRDYIRANTSEVERNEILAAAADLLLGRRWREGKVQLRQSYKLEINALHGAILGNERTVVNHLLWKALHTGDQTSIRRAARLAIDFASQLKIGDRFRDLHQVSNDSLVLLEASTNQYPEQVALLSKMDGHALRMLGRSEEALQRLQQALNINNAHFSNEDYALTYMEVAFAHRGLDDNDASVEAAETVLKYANAGSGLHMQATELIATIREDEQTLRKTMTDLLQIAQDKGRKVTAHNIAISLAQRTKDLSEAKRLYALVLDSRGDDYNMIRAVLGKGELLVEHKILGDLTRKEKRLLGAAYTYTHAQRLSGLFDQAHDVIWQLFASQPNPLPVLLALYRHSSFQWRLRGEFKRELLYLRELERHNPLLLDVRSSEKMKFDLEYFRRRQLAFQLPASADR